MREMTAVGRRCTAPRGPVKKRCLRLLKDVGADVGCEDETGKRPLHYAAEKGHESAVRALIKMGASVDHADELGQTSLHLAAMRSRLGGHALLQKGADVRLSRRTREDTSGSRRLSVVTIRCYPYFYDTT